MKRVYSILLLLIVSTGLFAQTTGENFEYGKPTEDEFAMTVCDLDSEAGLVFLLDHYDFAIEVVSNSFQQTRTYTRRLKVLKDDGVSAGDLEVNLFGEELVKLEAVVINRDENGDVVSSKLGKDMTFREKIGPSSYRVKASLPDVKVGSIIDVVYKVTANNIGYIPTIYLQHKYPSLRSEAYVHMPDFFVYYVDYHEELFPIYKNINYKDYAGNRVRYKERWIEGVAINVPPLKDEPFVWNIGDYYSSMSFELKSVEYAYQPLSYSYSWEDVFNNLTEAEVFGKHLKMSNPLKDETAAALKDKTSDREKIMAVMDLLSDKITWNEDLSNTSVSPKAALKEGKGNSADINFLLMSMLKDAGFECTPILLNPKNTRKIGKYPSLHNIYYFLLSTKINEDGSEKEVFLDGTSKWNSINVMAPEFFSSEAVRFNKADNERFVDLSTIGKGSTNYSVKASLSEDGTVTTDMNIFYSGMEAFLANSYFESYDKDDDFFKELMDGESFRNLTGTFDQGRDQGTVKMKFDLLPDDTGDVIYLKPTLVDFVDTDIFPSEKRQLPIDFDFPSTIRFRAMLMLGNGWEIEGLPQNSRFSLGDNDMSFSYKAIKGNGVVQIVAELIQNTSFYTPDTYEDLRQFYGEIGNVLEGRIAIKKVQQ